MAFRESDGEFMWQQTHVKLESGRANDWPFQGVASSPLVEGEKLYYVSNRGVLWCLDIKGFTDGENDGPLTNEKLTGPKDADAIWAFDMMEEVGTYPHNLANSSPVIWGDLIFVSTSNGHDESHVNVPSPKAPAIIALNKTTGKLVWEDNSVEDRILHGQWSTPAVGRIGGVEQVVSGQGDGWVRGYEATTGKKLWEFDTNPKESVWPRTRNEIIATPVIYQDVVYLANGQDPEHGEGVGHFYAIDATKRGNITESGKIFQFDKIRRSVSTAAIADGLIYIPDFSGFFHCLDAKTGQEYWVHDLTSAIWSSALVVDGKVYIGNEDGDIVILQAGKEKKVLATITHGQRGLRDAGAGAQHAVHHEPQPALRPGGEIGRSTLRRSTQSLAERRRADLRLCVLCALCVQRRSCCRRPDRVAVAVHAQASAAALAAVPREPAADGRHARTAPPATLKLLWKYEVGESIDSSAAIVGRHGLRRRRNRRSRRDRPADRKAPLEVHGGESDRRVVAGRRSRHGLCRRRRRRPARRSSERRQPALDVQDGRRNQVLAGCRRYRRAGRFVRRISLCAGRGDGQRCAGSTRPMVRFTRRRPFTKA